LKTLVIGLGNPIMTDDGAGLEVVRRLRKKLPAPDVEFIEASVGGIGLLDQIAGYDRLILIDTIRNAGGIPGQIYRLSPNDLGPTNHLCSPHDIGFKQAIKLGEKVGLEIPREIVIYAIEAQDALTFAEGCTRVVAEAVEELVRRIIAEWFDHS